MKKILLIFLFIILSSNFSQAYCSEKITIDDIENIFFSDERYKKKKDNETWSDFFLRIHREMREEIKAYEVKDKKAREERTRRYKEEAKENETWLEFLARTEYPDIYNKEEETIERKKAEEKRKELRGIAKSDNHYDIIRVVLTRSEKNQKRKPGDIFYVLDSIEFLINKEEKKKEFIKKFEYQNKKKPLPGMRCTGHNYCIALNKSTYKRVQKFKKDTSNEKVLGKKLTRYIKQQKMIFRIKEKLGTDNFALIGDMMNLTVVDVKKNNISPELKIRRVLLKKYIKILGVLKNKIDNENYEFIDKDISKLSKIFESFKKISSTHKLSKHVDEAVYILFEPNKFVQKSILNSKDNNEEKLLALTSIYFMKSFVESILSVIPEKYYIETKELPKHLFFKSEIKELEDTIDKMIKKNKKIRSLEWNKNKDIIKEYINVSYVVKSLDKLGMKNIESMVYTHSVATRIAEQNIRDNLDNELLKEAKKIFQDTDRDGLSEITKEASDIASEISSRSSNQMSETGSILDKKIGNNSLKNLIGAGVIR